MAFASYLGDFDVDAETNRLLDVALEMTRAALGLADDFANGIIARQIVELARAGERNPDLLCEGALKKLRFRAARHRPREIRKRSRETEHMRRTLGPPLPLATIQRVFTIMLELPKLLEGLDSFR
jgi:hypothetical protein